MRIKLMALVAAVSFTLPVGAQTADPVPPAPVTEKKVCRRLDQTGSILGSRPTCHTKSEWAKIDAANGRKTDQALENSRRVGNGGNAGQF